MRSVSIPLVVFAFTLVAGPAAALDPADKCEASKNTSAGKYYACRAKAEATAIKTGAAADYSKCSAKFDQKWDGAETSGAGSCPDNVLTPAINAFLAGQASSAAAIIGGAAIPSCGDGSVNAVGEVCDGVDLNGYSCVSLGHISGTLACNGSCDLDVSGCAGCPPGTELVDGLCWILAAPAGAPDVGSCDTACASVGLTCNEAALATVGSGGTTDDCREILDEIDQGGAPHVNSSIDSDDVTFCGSVGDYAAGCVLFVEPGALDGALRLLHSGGSTACSADLHGGACSPAGSIRRACACN